MKMDEGVCNSQSALHECEVPDSGRQLDKGLLNS